MLRTVSQVTTDLAVAYPQDQLQTKPGGTFQYVPWDVAVRVLDRIFTPFGWSAKPISYSLGTAGVYLAAVELTVSARDEESGEVVSVSRCGFGRGVAQPSRAEFDAAEKQGMSPPFSSHSILTHDTAASAAGSDALVKATKLLGDAFALYLYGEKRSTKPAQAQATSRTNVRAISPNLGFRPSEKQQVYLTKAGFPPEKVATMQAQDWKTALDAFFQQGQRADGTTDPEFKRRNAPVAVAAGAENDDIPF